MSNEPPSLKHVLITGASSGIGAQIAADLDNMGYNCILLGRNEVHLKKTQSQLKNSSHIKICDQSNPKEIEALELPEKICGLINNAGIFLRGPAQNFPTQDWNSLFSTNLLGPALLTQKVIPHLKANSSEAHRFIINISSTAAVRPVVDTAAYGALKAALTHYTKVLALELASDKICVNSVSPGIIDTPIHKLETLSASDRETVAGLQPLGRYGQPQDISSMIEFLCHNKNNWVTGSDFIIDGGISLQ